MIQMISGFAAKANVSNANVKPRNLAKSVTVG
jgi:hypothetical protein